MTKLLATNLRTQRLRAASRSVFECIVVLALCGANVAKVSAKPQLADMPISVYEHLDNGDNYASNTGYDVNTLPLAYAADKRSSWQSLQGPWGKRAGAFNDNALDSGSAENVNNNNNNDDDEVFLAEHWLPVLINNGEHAEPLVKYSLVYLTNAATLNRLANQAKDNNQFLAHDSGDADAFDITNEKRTWKNMNAAWGKRRTIPPSWNKFGGAWGKREPGWNNLKGMWGKRASKDWQKLHGGWGKRSQLDLE